MRKAERKIKVIEGIEYTLGEPDYPKIQKGDFFHIGGMIRKCIGRDNFIRYNGGVSWGGNDCASFSLCRKVLSKRALAKKETKWKRNF